MRQAHRSLAILLATGLLAFAATAGAEESVLARVKEETKHSVVFIRGYVETPQGLIGKSTGSGFVIKEGEKLFVVTNYHVAGGANELWGSVDSRTIPPVKLALLGYSPFLDLALLTIENPDGLVPVRLGDSNALTIGETVIAIGSPLGIRFLAFQGRVADPDGVPAAGVISPSAIISDAKVNPGNSGGPLFTVRGEVVGVNTALSGPNPMTLSIPIDHLKIVLPRLLLGGELKHAMMGANIRNSWEMNPPDYKFAKIEPPKRPGVLVIEVVPKSPAAKAGVKPGDLIIEVTRGGVKYAVPGTTELMKVMMLRAIPDDRLMLLVLRGENQYHTISPRLAERPAPTPAEEE